MIDPTPSTPRWMRSVARDLDARHGATAPQLPSKPRVAPTPRAHVGAFGCSAP